MPLILVFISRSFRFVCWFIWKRGGSILLSDIRCRVFGSGALVPRWSWRSVPRQRGRIQALLVTYPLFAFFVILRYAGYAVSLHSTLTWGWGISQWPWFEHTDHCCGCDCDGQAREGGFYSHGGHVRCNSSTFRCCRYVAVGTNLKYFTVVSFIKFFLTLWFHIVFVVYSLLTDSRTFSWYSSLRRSSLVPGMADSVRMVLDRKFSRCKISTQAAHTKALLTLVSIFISICTFTHWLDLLTLISISLR